MLLRSLTLALVVATLSSLSAFAQAPSPAWKRLYADEAKGSSYLQSNWNKYDENYHPAYALDGDPKTAWVEGKDGNGEGETLTIPLSDLKTARAIKLRVFNGYQKSQKLLDANAAPKDVTITLRNQSGEVTGTQKATLKKEMGAQEVVVAVNAGEGVSSVTLRIDSTHAGKVYKDGCLSDIEVFADSDVGYVERAEKAKLGVLKAWIGERKVTAQAFAKLPRGYPFAQTHFKAQGQSEWKNEEISAYDEKKEMFVRVPGKKALNEQLAQKKPEGITATIFSADDFAAIAEVQAIGKEKGASIGSTWQRVDVARATPLPDGFEQLSGGLVSLKALSAFFDLSTVTFFEAEKEAAGVSRSKPKANAEDEMGYVRTWTTTNARVARHDDGKTPKRVFFSERRVVEEREMVDTTDHYVLDFSEAGRIVRARRVGSSGDWMSAAVVDFTYDGAGKVTSVKQKLVSGGIGAQGDWNNGIGCEELTIAAAPNS